MNVIQEEELSNYEPKGDYGSPLPEGKPVLKKKLSEAPVAPQSKPSSNNVYGGSRSPKLEPTYKKIP